MPLTYGHWGRRGGVHPRISSHPCKTRFPCQAGLVFSVKLRSFHHCNGVEKRSIRRKLAACSENIAPSLAKRFDLLLAFRLDIFRSTQEHVLGRTDGPAEGSLVPPFLFELDVVRTIIGKIGVGNSHRVHCLHLYVEIDAVAAV